MNIIYKNKGEDKETNLRLQQLQQRLSLCIISLLISNLFVVGCLKTSGKYEPTTAYNSLQQITAYNTITTLKMLIIKNIYVLCML